MMTEIPGGENRQPYGQGQEYLCPCCGAVLPAAAAACPRCGMQFDDTARKAQIEQRLQQPTSYTAPAAAPPDYPSPVPAAAAIPQPAVPAPPTAPLPRAKKPMAKILLLGGACLFVLVLIVAVISAIGTSLSGYNSSPEKLVEGLNKAYAEKDKDLLLSLFPPDDRLAYQNSNNTIFSTPMKIELLDVIEGNHKKYALILVTYSTQFEYSSGESSFYNNMISLGAKSIDGAWYFETSSLSYFISRS